MRRLDTPEPDSEPRSFSEDAFEAVQCLTTGAEIARNYVCHTSALSSVEFAHRP